MATKGAGAVAKQRAESIAVAFARGRTSFVGRARRFVGASSDAEDVVQEAVVAALGRAGSVRDDANVAAWLGRIVDRKAIDVARRASRTARLASTLEPDAIPSPSATPERCACARSLAQELRPHHAEALRRVDERGEPVGAVAASLGISANALSVRLFRARAELRATMKRHCGTTDPRACDDCACRARACCAPVEE